MKNEQKIKKLTDKVLHDKHYLIDVDIANAKSVKKIIKLTNKAIKETARSGKYSISLHFTWTDDSKIYEIMTYYQDLGFQTRFYPKHYWLVILWNDIMYI